MQTILRLAEHFILRIAQKHILWGGCAPAPHYLSSLITPHTQDDQIVYRTGRLAKPYLIKHISENSLIYTKVEKSTGCGS